VVKHGIENNKEFALAGDERGLGVLTIGTQQIESSDGRIAANSRHRSHIQDAPDLCASARDTTAAAQFSNIAVKRCQPGQCSDLVLGFKRLGTDPFAPNLARSSNGMCGRAPKRNQFKVRGFNKPL